MIFLSDMTELLHLISVLPLHNVFQQPLASIGVFAINTQAALFFNILTVVGFTETFSISYICHYITLNFLIRHLWYSFAWHDFPDICWAGPPTSLSIRRLLPGAVCLLSLINTKVILQFYNRCQSAIMDCPNVTNRCHLLAQ